ncbi:MAG: OadG family protein [Chloroflexi bacterium]|nr:OadG family protein [Chloroflexota bacterium]MBT5627380.1 OadG family protein [Chloroflexota bacterium]
MLNDGLTLSLVGMGVVFAVLAILALSIKGISLLDKEASPAPAASVASSASSTTPAQESASSEIPGEITGEQVAAIAVALALSEPKSASSIPSSIARAGESAGSWLQSGRMRVLGSNSSGARERRN